MRKSFAGMVLLASLEYLQEHIEDGIDPMDIPDWKEAIDELLDMVSKSFKITDDSKINTINFIYETKGAL